jgi:5-methylcytosine-specific restriction endonuclease McrA
MQMLDRRKELLSGKHPCGIDLNTLLSELATTWLEKNDPAERNKRRAKRKKSRKPKRTDPGETSRHISPATRDAVYARDSGRCTYLGSNGRRCESKWDLEIHHDEVQYARGGSRSIANLRLLCAAHNKLEAERVYGKNHMEKFNRKIE